MKYEHKMLGEILHRINVSVTPKEIEESYHALVSEFQQIGKMGTGLSAKPNLRDIELSFGPQIKAMLPQRIMQKTFKSILQEKKLTPITPVQFQNNPLNPNKDFSFWGQFETAPEIKNINTQGVEFTVQPNLVTEEKVKQGIAEVLSQIQNLVEVSPHAIATPGDFALLDFEATVEGQALPQASKKDQKLRIGGNAMAKEIEEAMLNMKVGEQKNVQINYATSFYQKELAGKKVDYKITLKELKRQMTPELSDELVVKKLSQMPGNPKSVADLKNLVRQSIEAKLTAANIHSAKFIALQQLIELNPFEVPSSLIAIQKASMLKAAQQQATPQRPFSPPPPGSPQDHDITAAATNVIRVTMLVEALAKENRITCSPVEIENHISFHAKQFNAPIALIRKQFESPTAKAQLRYAIIENKVMKLFEKSPDQKNAKTA